ncbi:MAG: PIN domain-containing protein [Dehalococcoidia bacterium]
MNSKPAAARARTLVLDTNILIRAVLGRRVRSLLESYAEEVYFLTPDLAYEEVQAHLPQILTRRRFPPEAIRQILEQEFLPRLPLLVAPVPRDVYADLEPEARQRLKGRDESDSPFLALALRLNCPIWTEDADFFGSGVATWTTDRVEMFLNPTP